MQKHLTLVGGILLAFTSISVIAALNFYFEGNYYRYRKGCLHHYQYLSHPYCNMIYRLIKPPRYVIVGGSVPKSQVNKNVRRTNRKIKLISLIKKEITK